jgi:hypothetical protein
LVQTQDEQVIQLLDAISKYGQPKLLTSKKAVQVFNTRNHGLVCMIEGEGDSVWMVPGWHFANVLDRYLFPLPVPNNVLIEGVYFSLLEEKSEAANGTN